MWTSSAVSQTTLGDWDGAFARLAGEVQRLLARSDRSRMHAEGVISPDLVRRIAGLDKEDRAALLRQVRDFPEKHRHGPGRNPAESWQ